MKITFASPSKNNARKKEKKKGMAMAKLFALDTNTKQYYILCHFIRNEYVTRMYINRDDEPLIAYKNFPTYGFISQSISNSFRST